MMRRLSARLGRGVRIAGAFLEIGWSTAAKYPLSFVSLLLRPVVPVIMFFFVAQLVPSGGSVGGDYFTFTVIGFVVMEGLAGALSGVNIEVQTAIQQGRFEMLLVEPIRWSVLPFGLALFPIALRVVFAGLASLLALTLGARLSWSGLLPALTVGFLAMLASLAIGVLSSSVGILSKRSDPVLTAYTLLVGILSGVAFPLELLPPIVRGVSWLIPHTYAISAIRRLLLPEGGELGGPTVAQAVVALMVFNLVVYPLIVWLYGRIMDAGRRTGMLAGY